MIPIMDIQQILKMLPHRYPFIMIDRVISYEPSKSLVAIKNVTINEAFFTGHFPERPVMPGVLILEALAQAGVILAYKSSNTSPADALYLFAGIDDARFKRVVEPGDQLQLKVEVLRIRRDVLQISGKAYVGDELACSAICLSARKPLDAKDSKGKTS